jgi:hypoxanthine phosphoribosyltransferase
MAIEEMISSEKIRNRTRQLALEICRDYSGQELVVVGVLNGAFVFMADLIREMDIPVIVEFIKASSYGEGTKSSGQINFDLWPKSSLKGKNILVVEDILDTGLTLTKIMEKIAKENPKSLKLATLLHKPARTTHAIKIDYLGFQIEDRFVIGYGLDFAGKFRELPYIGVYSED